MTALQPLLGGVMIGASAIALLLFLGRIAGISGIAGGLLAGKVGDRLWRACFLLGLLAGGAALRAIDPHLTAFTIERSPLLIVVAGVLVGYGTRLGGGCTSGHGVMHRSRPLLAGTFAVPERLEIDAALVGGAALFGVGWGLVGYCPGPAIVSLGAGAPSRAVCRRHDGRHDALSTEDRQHETLAQRSTGCGGRAGCRRNGTAGHRRVSHDHRSP